MYTHFFKRIIDIIIGLIALPFVLLVVVIFVPFIYFTDKGPVFYNATRAGKDYKPFKMFKLRSMYVNAPDIRNADGSTFNSDNDPRVTPIGKFMRKTSLDEFPQFLNILIGDMSFIGPRPERKFFIDQIMEHDHRYIYLYQIRPGVTSYATLYNGYTDTMEKMLKRLEYDLYYLGHRSWLFDIKILWLTFWKIVSGKDI